MASVEQIDEELGIACPGCGCRHCPESRHAVAKTITLGAKRSIRRVRVCRHCGRRFNTYERVAGDNGKLVGLLPAFLRWHK